jgi:hypothetical protein
MNNTNIWTALIIAVFFPTCSYAHHSGSEYSSEIRVIEGEIVAVLWRNPHISLKVKSREPNGAEVIWQMEGWPPRRVANRDSISVGDHVLVAAKRRREENSICS